MPSAEMLCTSLLMLILMIRHKVNSFFGTFCTNLPIYTDVVHQYLYVTNDGEQYKVNPQWSSYK